MIYQSVAGILLNRLWELRARWNNTYPFCHLSTYFQHASNTLTRWIRWSWINSSNRAAAPPSVDPHRRSKFHHMVRQVCSNRSAWASISANLPRSWMVTIAISVNHRTYHRRGPRVPWPSSWPESVRGAWPAAWACCRRRTDSSTIFDIAGVARRAKIVWVASRPVIFSKKAPTMRRIIVPKAVPWRTVHGIAAQPLVAHHWPGNFEPRPRWRRLSKDSEAPWKAE